MKKSKPNRTYEKVENQEEKHESLVATAEIVGSTSKEGDAVLGEGETWTRGEVQPLAYRDKKFAIAFVVQLLFVFSAALFAPSTIRSLTSKSGISYHWRKNERELKRSNLMEKRRINGTIEVEELLEGNAFDVSLGNSFGGEDEGSNEEILEENEIELGSLSSENTGTHDETKKAGKINSEFFDENALAEIDFRKAIDFSIFVVMASLAISIAFILGALLSLQRHAEKVIKGSLFFIVGYFLFGGLISLLMPNVALGTLDEENRDMAQEANEDGKVAAAVVDFILALVFACYAKAIWRDIPFAASTMRTGVTACKANLGVFVYAFITPMLNLVIFVLQLMALVTLLNFTGAFEDEPSDVSTVMTTIAVILISLSVYWTSEVIKNISTVIVSGAVGTWWFSPHEAQSFCSSAVVNSLKRAITYSFGSICFGSLIVAVINVVIDSLRRSQRNRNCVLLFCVITCLLEFFERIAEYFNKWAFVYVGLYGYDYMTAGKNVVTLFRARGWSSIISNNLVNRTLMMVATFIGLATGLIITMIWNIFEIGSTQDDDQVVMVFSIIYFYAAFMVSLINASVLLSVVGAASDTAIVCFAEAPADLEENHPELSAMMHQTYAQAWPNVNFRHEVV